MRVSESLRGVVKQEDGMSAVFPLLHVGTSAKWFLDGDRELNRRRGVIDAFSPETGGRNLH